MLDLSVIIVNYNKAELLKQCLESLYDNISQSLHFEVIVIDNASVDQSCALVKEHFPDVILIANKTNVGFAAGNNQGLRIAQGKYLFLLNNDTFVLAHAVEKLIQFLNENTAAGAVGPTLLNADGHTVQVQGSGRGDKFWLSVRPVSVAFLTGAAFMIRRQVLEEVGELDENFFFYNEDLDWCRRIISKKWKIFYVPQAKIIHYGGQSTSLNSARTFVEGIRGGLYFCSKYYPALFGPYRTLLFIGSIIAMIYHVVRLLLWPGKQRSCTMLNGYAQIVKLCLFWKASQTAYRKKMTGAS